MIKYRPTLIFKVEKIISDILSDGDITNIRSDLHRSKLWADSFWRRKNYHSRRIDPEIELLRSMKFDTILEIGAAYGRIANKITEKMNINYTGIEICDYFKPYYNEYNKEGKFEIIFTDFFDKMIDKTFDIVLLPMNTFPTFTYSSISMLLDKVKKYLNDDGKFIFSTYKLHEDINSDNINRYKRRIAGELLIDIKDRIALESHQYSLEITEYGASSKSIQMYHRLDNKYNILEKELFWTYIEYITHDSLLELLINSDFKVEVNETSHSMVYIATQ